MKLKLAEKRRSNLISKRRLHQITGLSRSYLTEMEKGKKNPSLLTMCKLAKALNCTVDDLVDWDAFNAKGG